MGVTESFDEHHALGLGHPVFFFHFYPAKITVRFFYYLSTVFLTLLIIIPTGVDSNELFSNLSQLN